MSLQFRCPSCNTLLSTSTDKLGAMVTCGRCHEKIQIPPVASAANPMPALPPAMPNASPPIIVIQAGPLLGHKPRTASRTKTMMAIAGVIGLIALGLAILYNSPAMQDRGGAPLLPVVNLFLSPEQEAVKRYVLRNSFTPDAIHFEKWFPAKNANPNDTNAFKVESRKDPVVVAKLDKLDRLIQSVQKPIAPQAPFSSPMLEQSINAIDSMGGYDHHGRRITSREYRRLLHQYEEELSKYDRKMEEYNNTTTPYNNLHSALMASLYVEHRVMTADRVVRVITRTNEPIIGLIRTDDFYYLKDGKVVKWETGTPASQEGLINIYYPGAD